MKFLDQAKIHVKAGNGGAGAVSFRREKFVEFGGPDGGNGGRGGNVIVHCVDGLNTLIDYRYQQHFKAKTGGHGMGRDRSGAKGADIILKVPVGTQVYDETTETLLADFTQIGQRSVIASGGNGGFGNAHFKSSTNRAPRQANPGLAGEERTLLLRLKLIADAGLVGLPNAGKSTFLSAVSAAKPKIADYPFTTLHPGLGVVRYFESEFVLADIPGLIEGAHDGVGLGDKFLGHIERCQVLLHLIDATQDDPAKSYHTIRDELAAYGHGLIDKLEIIALTKCDSLSADEIEKRRADFIASVKKQVIPISAVSRFNMDKVLQQLGQVIAEKREENIKSSSRAQPPDLIRGEDLTRDPGIKESALRAHIALDSGFRRNDDSEHE